MIIQKIKIIHNGQISSENNLDELYISTFEKEITKTVEKQGYNVSSCKVEGVFDSEEEDVGISKIEIILDSKKSVEILNEDVDSNNIINSVQEIEKVEININNTEETTKTDEEMTSKDIKDLKNYLSQYYEIDKKIIDIQIK